MEGFDLLRLDGLFAAGWQEEDGILLVDAYPNHGEVPTCGCGLPSIKKHGKRTAQVRDHVIQRMPTHLRVTRQRYRCENCRAVMLEDAPGIDSKRDMTVRFRDQLIQDAISRTFKDAGDLNGVDEQRCRKLFKAFAAKRLENYTFTLPRVLGMDEKYIQGSTRFVIGDVEARRMLDLQPSRKKLDLEAYFGQFDIMDRAKVEVITQDMYWGYKALNELYFRNAVVVVDKFHVLRYANLAVEVARKSVQSKLDNDGRISLKHKIRLLGSRVSNLDQHGLWQLKQLFYDHPLLETAVTCKEWFYDIYECQTRAEAEAAYDAWVELLPTEMRRPFAPILRFMREKRWRKLVFNYFDHPYTNGYIEGLNGLIDQINRAGRGMKLPILRAKALLRYGDLKPLTELYDFNLRLDNPETEIILSTLVGHGVDLSTFNDDLRRESFW